MRKLKKHLENFYKILAVMVNTTKRLRHLLPGEMWDFVRALRGYSINLGEDIYKLNKRYTRNKATKFMSVVAMASGFDGMRTYRDRMEVCENFYAITIRTVLL